MNKNQDKELFPKNFFWGASVSSHQVEGGNENQWTVWELENAKIQSQTAHRKHSNLARWSEIKARAETPENYVSGRGVDHYKRYDEDFDIAKKLNFNSLRVGIEWARIEPEEGKWDDAEIRHYREYLASLRKRGLEPFLNVWHWTLPIWFTEKGGFENSKNLADWERFVTKIAEEYTEDLTYIITLNEPNVYSTMGFHTDEFNRDNSKLIPTIKTYKNLVSAHKKAYRILKTKKPSLQIGVATQLANIQAKNPHSLFDEFSTKWMRYFWNWWFLNRINRYQDFVGFNYYFTDYYTGLMKRKNPAVPNSDLGWYMEPEGIYPILLRAWSHYKKPIFITENGLADEKDEYRRWWIEETIVAMERAISEGVDLRGYFHWSLLDNFEWAYGWWPKFGLVSVDRENGMKRTVRPSAKWFASRIKKL
jgi:beta-glucosidase